MKKWKKWGVLKDCKTTINKENCLDFLSYYHWESGCRYGKYLDYIYLLKRDNFSVKIKQEYRERAAAAYNDFIQFRACFFYTQNYIKRYMARYM